MIRLWAVVLPAIVLLSGKADAQERKFMARGAGLLSCGAWSAARRDETAQPHQEWVLGFLSGLGASVAVSGLNPLEGADNEGVWAWIDNYCRAHPLDDLLIASEAFATAHPH